MPIARLAVVAALVAGLSGPAQAWGQFGHRAIATIAMAEVHPATRKAIRALLRKSAAVDTPGCPFKTLEDASAWPDCVRSVPRYAEAAPWHYQNISVCDEFDITAKCPDGNCVTAQLTRQAAILHDRRRSVRVRLEALAYVVHFAGDLHQPVHIGDKGDRGGNDVKADYGVKPRLNLHRIWDTDLAERALTTPPVVGPASITPKLRAQFKRGDVTSWTHESWQAAKDVAYGNLRGVADKCAMGESVGAIPRAQIDEAYIVAALPVVRARVEAAGVRIAGMLDAAFARRAR